MQPGVRRFIDELTGLGLDPAVEAELVVSRVTPVDGARAGTPVETGVALDELESWPELPPHWVHLPDGVHFRETNSKPSPKPGWLMHSRQLTGWGDAPAGVAWAAHVRAVLSEAVA